MNFLIFLVSVIYSFVFYFFYLATNNRSIFSFNFSSDIYFGSISGNLIIESIVFVILGILFYLYFSDFSFKKDIVSNKLKLINSNINNKKTSNLIKFFGKNYNLSNINYNDFFKNYLYYIGFIFLYLGIYFIYKSLEFTEFSYIILFINIIVLILFFITHKFFIFRDFIKINLILFSVYYIVFYVYNFILNIPGFPLVDIINSFLVLFNFILVFYNDFKILKYKKVDNALLSYFFIFIFIFLSFSIWNIIGNFDFKISFILIIISTLLSFLSYYIFSKIQFLKNNIIILRIISFIFGYLASIIGFYYFLHYSINFTIFFILIYFSVFFFNTHNKFQNYISFFFSNFIFIFIIYFFYSRYFFLMDDGLIFLVGTIILSLEGIILTYFYDFKYEFDYYFFHIFSYIINFIGIVFYLIYFKIDLFTLGIIFFVESLYIFLSYYRLKQLKK